MKRKIVILTVLALALSILLASCVGSKQVVEIKIVEGTFSHEYEVGQTPDLSKIQARITFNDGSVILVNADQLTLGKIDTTTAGVKKFNISYGNFTMQTDVTVKQPYIPTPTPEATLTGISVVAGSYPTRVAVGGLLDLYNIGVKAEYSDNTSKTLSYSELTISALDATTAGEKTLTITYGGKSTSINVNVYELSKIELKPGTVAPSVIIGEALDTTDAVIIATYSDGVTEEVTTGVSFEEFDNTEAGVKPLGFSWGGKTGTANITVVGVRSLQLVSGTLVDTVTVGDTLDTTGIEVFVEYTDGKFVKLDADSLEIGTVNTATPGKKTLNISYLDGELNVNITVKAIPVIVSISIKAGTVDTVYTDTGTVPVIDVSEMVVTAIYDNNTTVTLTAEDYIVTQPTEGNLYLVVTLKSNSNVATSVEITQTPAVITGISATVTDPKVLLGDAFDSSKITITAIYSNGTTTTLANSVATISTPDTDTAGVKTVDISYGEFDTSVNINVLAVKSLSISGAPAVLDLGVTFDTANIEIIVTYDDITVEGENYVTRILAYSDVNFDVVPDTSTAGEKTLSVSYKGATANATVVVRAVSSITVVPGSVVSSVIKGDIFDKSTIKLTVVYTNGDAEEILANNSALTLGDVSTAEAGVQQLAISYKGFTTSYAVTVKAIESITVITDNFNTKMKVGDSDGEWTVAEILAALELSVKFVGDSAVYTVESGFTVSSSIDTTAPAVVTVTVSYKGVSVPLSVVINSDDSNYVILGVERPTSISSQEGAGGIRGDFLDNNNYDISDYVVGDDNPYVFKLILTVFDIDAEKDMTITEYKSSTKIYLVETVGDEKVETYLEPGTAAYNLYIDSINELKNSVDFAEGAIGKSFKIVSRPEGTTTPATEAYQYVVVQDAYNIYTAKELNIVTNYDSINRLVEADGVTHISQPEAARRFLEKYGIVRPENLAGIVLHNELVITMDDLPPEYVFTDGTGIWDCFGIYTVAVSDNNPEFSIYGNYYTIYSNGKSYGGVGIDGIENVDEKDAWDELLQQSVSHSQLFKFVNAEAPENYYNLSTNFDLTKYKVNLENVKLMDDDPNDPANAESARSRLGLIGIKAQRVVINVENTVIERFFTSFFLDRDQVIGNLNQVKFFNAWQNHIYIWAKNDLQPDGDASVKYLNTDGSYNNATANITNSVITVCGGPVIITQTDSPGLPKSALSGPEVNLDENTEIWTYVQADSIWFQTFGAADYAAQIHVMSKLFENFGTSFSVMNPSPDGVAPGTFDDVNPWMNIIIVNMESGSIGGSTDVDGTFTVNGKEYLYMDGGKKNTANDTVNQLQSATGGAAPIFLVGDGIVWTDTTALYTPQFVPSADGTQYLPVAADQAYMDAYMSTEGYMTLFFGNMGIVLGDYHKTAE